MLAVRYYVLAHDGQFRVMREGKPQGLHPTRERATESALFMASVEAARLQTKAEMFAEDERGQLVLERTIEPGDRAGLLLGGKRQAIAVGSGKVEATDASARRTTPTL